MVNDSGLSDARREERVLQLLRMLNHLLGKHKETSRRFLNMTVARVVAVSPQMRLVQVKQAFTAVSVAMCPLSTAMTPRTTRRVRVCCRSTRGAVLRDNRITITP